MGTVFEVLSHLERITVTKEQLEVSAFPRVFFSSISWNFEGIISLNFPENFPQKFPIISLQDCPDSPPKVT